MENSLIPLPHIVIVGSGFGGLFAAKMLQKSPVRITIIDKQNHHVFQPLLYQVATGFLSPEDVAVPIRGEFQRYPHIKVVMDEVRVVDSDKQEVTTASGHVHTYDYLILATGSVYNYFGHDEWKPYACSLKTLDEAIEIRRRILLAFEEAELIRDQSRRRDRLRFIIIGGGPTGVEMAGAIVDIVDYLKRGFHVIRPEDIKVVIIEAGERLLGGFTEELSDYTKEVLTSKHVEIRLHTMVKKVSEDTVFMENDQLKAGMILWSAGVKAAPLMEHFIVETDQKGRIKVTDTLSVPGKPSIFAIGDAAHYEQAGKPLPELASVAKQQGKFVGKLLRNKINGKSSMKSFHYRDWGTLATIGRNAAVADLHLVKMKGWVAYLFWGFVHILLLTGFSNRMAVFFSWLVAYINNKMGARIIIKR